jgi:hypothetical protein
VAIAKPRVGRVTADEFRGNISYADGAASLTNGQLRIAESSIALSGNVQTGNNPQFQFQANFDQTRIDRLYKHSMSLILGILLEACRVRIWQEQRYFKLSLGVCQTQIC